MESSHRKFTVMGGKLKHDVCEYITAMTSESKVEVHVGCDSQNHKRQIDLDFNSDSQYASHKLVSASSGYITSLGFNSKVKPDLLMAAWAANVLCQ